ncbi:SH3 domain-containing protein [Coleofasciculus sp. FACHB-T130]|uniref:SH3 domain-containing protein n=1 Tax=Cyanophyceae TaxID=3028117 RepID=UPI001688D4A8|nr:SH3 domain-containing protein [Coleofasciculus sp. FACHB-T130]MBD1879979.1 SH3 domain-containing protein [Coleofasciculus sp. FACHB-T130]
MKKMSRWGKPIALFSLGLSVVGTLNFPTPAISTTTTANTIAQSEQNSVQPGGSFEIAQSLVGQCRATKARIFVYTQRSLSSQTIRTLAAGEQVTLADNGSAGFIAISAPVTGYVQARDLTTCSGVNPTPRPTPSPTPTPNPTPSPNPTPTPTTSLCRVITYKGAEGMAVRTAPGKNGTRVGGVKLGDRVTLRTSPPPFTFDAERRAWVQITAPVAGWISYGFPSSNSTNLGTCR